MSAIYTDAADIPTAFPHPTGAATVINFNGVVSPFTTTPNPTAPASSSPSSTSASDCYYSDPSSSSSSASSSASPSRPAPRDSQLPPPSASQLPPSPRDLSVEAHQAEYRAHAYLANESIVKTKLAADKFLQNLFKTQSEPDKDILRAASAASRARLQNPFAYNNSRSSGSSGSSGCSSNSSSYYSGSSGSSGSSYSRSSSNPSNPSAPAPRGTAAQPSPVETDTAPAPEAASDLAIWPFGNLEISPPSPADIDQPLTEADFTGCIKLEDAISNIESTAPRGTAILGGVPLDSTTPVTPDAKTPPRMAVPHAISAQLNPVQLVAAPAPQAPSNLAIWQFDHLTISPRETISPPPPPCLNLATWPFHQCTTPSHGASWPLGP